MKPNIVVGAFGVTHAEKIACELDGVIILDLKSGFILRSRMGTVTVIHLSPCLFRMVFLLSAAPVLATHAEIEEQLWGEREDGGPDCSVSAAIDMQISRLRRKISPLGLVIKTEHGRGFELLEAHR